MERSLVPDTGTGETGSMKDLASALRTLGDHTRLRIISHLAHDSTGTLGAGELATRLGISQPAVSQHLKILKQEGIVRSERFGFHVYYSFNPERMSEIAGRFSAMQGAILDCCDKQQVREGAAGPMKIAYLFFSYTGNTRFIAEKMQQACGGDLIPVLTTRRYSTFTAYTVGALRSRQEEADPIRPEEIDVSGYDLLVIGSPVWAWKPAPPTQSLVTALRGSEGKRAVIYVTCGHQAGEALPLMERWLDSRGITVVSQMAFTKPDIDDYAIRNRMISMIIDASQDTEKGREQEET